MGVPVVDELSIVDPLPVVDIVDSIAHSPPDVVDVDAGVSVSETARRKVNNTEGKGMVREGGEVPEELDSSILSRNTDVLVVISMYLSTVR